jgi:AraC-like DNA-binding protein
MPLRLPLNRNIRHQLLFGIFVGLWLFLFLAFIGPFDSAPLSLRNRLEIMYGYGLVAIFSYALVIPLQHWWYEKSEDWTIFSEVIIITCFLCTSALFSFPYYRSSIVNGDYPLGLFMLKIFLPTSVILLPILLVGRWLIARPHFSQKTQVSLEESEIDYWKQKLEDLLAQEKIHLDPQLSLGQLATRLGTNTSLLSKTINQGYNGNFSELINGRRVEEVLKRIKAGRHQIITMAALAEECGFNSKATFNRSFKQHTQQSPSQYIKQLPGNPEHTT